MPFSLPNHEKNNNHLIIVIILIIISAFLIISPVLTGKAAQSIEKTYTYTKAICDDSNYCQDSIITCDGNQVKSIQPITGAAVQFEDDWKDPRGEEKEEKLCR